MQEAKPIHISNDRKRSEACIELLFNDYIIKKDTLLFKKAFAYAERYKALILQENTNKKSLLELYPNDCLLVKEQEFLQKQE